jgi:hypothetical protein
MGVSSFTNGVYTFEIRMIGKRAIFPICQSVTISTVPAPSPTPTRTPQATPTPTPTSPPAVAYTSGATINVTDTGYLKYTTSSGDTYFYCSTIGTQVLTDCLICSSIRDGIPFQDLASWTVINCGSSCSGGPSPSPTPTPSNLNYGHYIMTDCQTFQTRYTQTLPYETYNSGDRVEGSKDYFYVITGFTPSEPDPSLIFYVTPTGEYGCP